MINRLNLERSARGYRTRKRSTRLSTDQLRSLRAAIKSSIKAAAYAQVLIKQQTELSEESLRFKIHH